MGKEKEEKDELCSQHVYLKIVANNNQIKATFRTQLKKFSDKKNQ